jgi:hypothetical protein
LLNGGVMRGFAPRIHLLLPGPKDHVMKTRFAPARATGLGAAPFHLAAMLLLAAPPAAAQEARGAGAERAGACAGDNGGITLAPGFCATVLADNIGHARHLAVAADGVVYVNT